MTERKKTIRRMPWTVDELVTVTLREGEALHPEHRRFYVIAESGEELGCIESFTSQSERPVAGFGRNIVHRGKPRTFWASGGKGRAVNYRNRYESQAEAIRGLLRDN